MIGDWTSINHSKSSAGSCKGSILGDVSSLIVYITIFIKLFIDLSQVSHHSHIRKFSNKKLLISYFILISIIELLTVQYWRIAISCWLTWLDWASKSIINQTLQGYSTFNIHTGKIRLLLFFAYRKISKNISLQAGLRGSGKIVRIRIRILFEKLLRIRPI